VFLQYAVTELLMPDGGISTIDELDRTFLRTIAPLFESLTTYAEPVSAANSTCLQYVNDCIERMCEWWDATIINEPNQPKRAVPGPEQQMLAELADEARSLLWEERPAEYFLAHFSGVKKESEE
jgi:hypothetical protein